jgi:hypothetical protein
VPVVPTALVELPGVACASALPGAACASALLARSPARVASVFGVDDAVLLVLDPARSVASPRSRSRLVAVALAVLSGRSVDAVAELFGPELVALALLPELPLIALLLPLGDAALGIVPMISTRCPT